MQVFDSYTTDSGTLSTLWNGLIFSVPASTDASYTALTNAILGGYKKRVIRTQNTFDFVEKLQSAINAAALPLIQRWGKGALTSALMPFLNENGYETTENIDGTNNGGLPVEQTKFTNGVRTRGSAVAFNSDTLLTEFKDNVNKYTEDLFYNGLWAAPFAVVASVTNGYGTTNPMNIPLFIMSSFADKVNETAFINYAFSDPSGTLIPPTTPPYSNTFGRGRLFRTAPAAPQMYSMGYMNYNLYIDQSQGGSWAYTSAPQLNNNRGVWLTYGGNL